MCNTCTIHLRVNSKKLSFRISFFPTVYTYEAVNSTAINSRDEQRRDLSFASSSTAPSTLVHRRSRWREKRDGEKHRGLVHDVTTINNSLPCSALGMAIVEGWSKRKKKHDSFCLPPVLGIFKLSDVQLHSCPTVMACCEKAMFFLD